MDPFECVSQYRGRKSLCYICHKNIHTVVPTVTVVPTLGSPDLGSGRVMTGLLWDQRQAVEDDICSVFTLSLNTVKRTDNPGRVFFLPDLSWGILCSEIPFSFNCVCKCTRMYICAFEHITNPLIMYRDPHSA